ncbi:MAG TPA: hypothetical protein DHT34_02755, partial [Cellvibrionales bacterium]|nr:hypothetical protein [Cellvibrionales bacterium]
MMRYFFLSEMNMLRSIRDNVKGKAAKVILGIMIVPFVFFGVGSLVDGGGVSDVLIVNGETVDQNELLLEMQLVRNQMLSRMGDNPDYSQLTEEVLAPVAIESLTRKTLINQALADMSMAVPDLMIEKLITGTPNFQVDGRFSVDLLNSFLANQRVTLPLLKARIANDIKERQLGVGLAVSNFSLPFSSQILIDIFNENRDVNWLKLPIIDVTKNVTVSNEDTQSYYEANKADYVSEQQLVIEYIELRRENLYAPVSDEQVQAEYTLQSEQFDSNESR